ncbi:hypothetical protein J7I93_17405, partial [Bacillus sp. ISL-47]|uniref:hypothetical protein n=1 Tax=Bacillus sp. ISL-47 TaxID=2819130 RepID=UPI001BE6C6CD
DVDVATGRGVLNRRSAVVFSKKTKELTLTFLFVQFSKINPSPKSDFINISFITFDVNNFFKMFLLTVISDVY